MDASKRQEIFFDHNQGENKREYKVYKVPVTEGLAGLEAAMALALPGDTVVMGNGEWTNVNISFAAKGAPDHPVVLRAETPGEVILNGYSTLTFSSAHLVVEGLCFKGGALNGGSIISFNNDNCRMTQCAIEDYNPPSSSIKYYWVFFEGGHNRMDYCYLKGKNHEQPMFGNQRGPFRYNKVDHCYIKDIPLLTGINGAEIFRIWGYGGNEELGDDGAFFTIEYNLFEQTHGEGQEIISLKSNRNVVQYNTILRSIGEINGRSGNYNTIRGNYILGGNIEGTGGIRISGQSHTIVNNYVEGVTGNGLSVSAGEYINEDLTGSYKPILRDGTPLGRVPAYGQVKNGVFAHNTFVNIGGYGILMSWGYKRNWPNAQRVLFPENNRIINNIIVKSGGSVPYTIYCDPQDTNPPLDRFTFQTNEFAGNVIYGGAAVLDREVPSIRCEDPCLTVVDGIYKLRADSPAINSAVGSCVEEDIEGRPRDAQPDIGAEEYSVSPAVRRPLTPADVGPAWYK